MDTYRTRQYRTQQYDTAQCDNYGWTMDRFATEVSMMPFCMQPNKQEFVRQDYYDEYRANGKH